MPWDRFLAGDDRALTPAQRRDARLFFTSAANGAGGAGCYSCHSGPMLNKQLGDEAGLLVVSSGDPYRREFLPDGVLVPGDSLVETLRFSIHRPASVPSASYTLALLSAQGTP